MRDRLNFDDIDSSSGGGRVNMPKSYHGLSFVGGSTLEIINKQTFDDGDYANTGIGRGVTSGLQDLIFDGGLTITGAHTFNLKSVELTSGSFASDSVEIIGYKANGKIKYDLTIPVNNSTPTLVDLEFHNVLSVNFHGEKGNGNFTVLDDLTATNILYEPDSQHSVGWDAELAATSLHDTHAMFASQMMHQAAAEF